MWLLDSLTVQVLGCLEEGGGKEGEGMQKISDKCHCKKHKNTFLFEKIAKIIIKIHLQ